MLDTTLTSAGWIIAVLIFIGISWVIYAIIKFVRALTELEQLVNTLEQALTTINGEITSNKALRDKLTEDK